MRTRPTAKGYDEGAYLLTAPNGVAFTVEDLSRTGSAGEGATGWWLRCLRGPHAARRFWKHTLGAGPAVEWHEVGTFPTLRAAKDAAHRASIEARQEGIA